MENCYVTESISIVNLEINRKYIDINVVFNRNDLSDNQVWSHVVYAFNTRYKQHQQRKTYPTTAVRLIANGKYNSIQCHFHKHM